MLASVLNNNLPIWVILVVSLSAALGPVIFNSLWRRFNGIEGAETGKLHADAASTTVTGATSLVKELQSEREYLLRTVKELRIQVDELLLAKARADRLSDQVARLESDLIKARAQRDAAHEENQDLKRRIDEVLKENTLLNKRVDTLEHELHNMRIHISTKDENIEVNINEQS